MLPRSILTDFSFLRPKLKMTQAESLAYLAKHHARLAAEQNETELDEPRLNLLLKRFGVKPEQISSRGLESHEMSGHSRSLLERTRFFEARARSQNSCLGALLAGGPGACTSLAPGILQSGTRCGYRRGGGFFDDLVLVPTRHWRFGPGLAAAL
jgi:hypothetical protein